MSTTRYVRKNKCPPQDMCAKSCGGHFFLCLLRTYFVADITFFGVFFRTYRVVNIPCLDHGHILWRTFVFCIFCGHILWRIFPFAFFEDIIYLAADICFCIFCGHILWWTFLVWIMDISCGGHFFCIFCGHILWRTFPFAFFF